MKAHLTDILRQLFEAREYRTLSESITGLPADPERITDAINIFCARELGSAVDGCLTIHMSVGAMFGLELEDGRKIALKIHRIRQNRESLQAVTAVQQFLNKKSFPCPPVIKPPEYFHKNAVATIEEYISPGEIKDTHAPPLRLAMAEKLAELISLIRNFSTHPYLLHSALPQDRLWPEPHNVLFDFEKTASGAEWIDRLAQEAKNAAGSVKGETAAGHADWSGKHFHFDGDTIVMIYDWDSLRIEDELEIVGHATATYTANWDIQARLTPLPEESAAFALEYQSARGKNFSGEELMKISASALYILAYSARCEHARDPEGKNITAGCFRDALRYAQKDRYFKTGI